MTREDIIRMAREAGLTHGQHWNKVNMTTAFMCDFANLVAKHEREACAKLFEPAICEAQRVCAKAIRARGNT
jgi:hypothetical protein